MKNKSGLTILGLLIILGVIFMIAYVSAIILTGKMFKQVDKTGGVKNMVERVWEGRQYPDIK